jgi:hypothetical protein
MARGALRLMADADGATPIAEVKRLEAAIEGGADMAVGSRARKAPWCGGRAFTGGWCAPVGGGRWAGDPALRFWTRESWRCSARS